MTLARKERQAINTANALKAHAGFWTAARKDTLRRLWRARVCATAIAAEIGYGCTRNAVIGKAHRMHLPPVSASEKNRRNGLSQRLRHQAGL